MTKGVMILLLFCSLALFAENKLARINDPDGYSNVRSGRGLTFPVVIKLDKGDLFYCEKTSSEWLSIISFSYQDQKQVEGFIHKSKVQFIEDLDNKTKKELLISILSEQQSLAEKFVEVCRGHHDIMYKATVVELENYSDLKYSPILEILPGYFCASGDTSVIQQFFATTWADSGSANETPSFTLGDCYICNPRLILSQIRYLQNLKQRNSIYESIEWGLLNHYNVDENGISKNTDYSKLMILLDVERRKSRP